MLGISGINPMMMGGMYGMMGMNNGQNVPQTMVQKYGNGYGDFGHSPYFNSYPMGIVPQRLNVNEEKVLKKFFRFLSN